jgi:hypothetical protein
MARCDVSGTRDPRKRPPAAAARTYEQRRQRQGAHHRKCMPGPGTRPSLATRHRGRVQSMNGAGTSAERNCQRSSLGVGIAQFPAGAGALLCFTCRGSRRVSVPGPGRPAGAGRAVPKIPLSRIHWGCKAYRKTNG